MCSIFINDGREDIGREILFYFNLGKDWVIYEVKFWKCYFFMCKKVFELEINEEVILILFFYVVIL